MTTHEINAHLAAGRRTFKVSISGGTVKAEIMETGLASRNGFATRQRSGVRIKLRDNSERRVESRDVVSLWTEQDEARYKNREQAVALIERIKGELLEKEIIDPTVRINSPGDGSMRSLALSFTGRDAIVVLDLLGVNSDISFEQKV